MRSTYDVCRMDVLAALAGDPLLCRPSLDVRSPNGGVMSAVTGVHSADGTA